MSATAFRRAVLNRRFLLFLCFAVIVFLAVAAITGSAWIGLAVYIVLGVAYVVADTYRLIAAGSAR